MYASTKYKKNITKIFYMFTISATILLINNDEIISKMLHNNVFERLNISKLKIKEWETINH